jgi:hypothetical protein
MDTLHEMKAAIAEMSPDDLAELQDYIRQQALRHTLAALFADAPPAHISAGTINMEQLRAGAESMWGGLDDDEIAAMIAAMNNTATNDDV